MALGMPQILINFRTAAATAITRSGRGIGAMILNDSNATADTGVVHYEIEDSTDIPTAIDSSNVDLIKKALLGTPSKIHTFLIPPQSMTTAYTTVNQASALKNISVMKANYICHPTGSAIEQSDLATWTKQQRANKNKTFKAVVANVAADGEGVINFTTTNIKVGTTTYTPAQYTARVMGAAAGVSLDRSLTYYEFPEVDSCDTYDDIDTHINNGELCLINEYDGNGVKIARGCNSLTTFTSIKGEDFRYIKIVESLDLIRDDIRDEFRNSYAGKIINDYNNKMLFVGAIQTYLKNLRGSVLDASETIENTVDIDIEKNVDYATNHGVDVSGLSNQQLRELNTGTHVYLSGAIKPVNAMEDLQVDFTL